MSPCKINHVFLARLVVPAVGREELIRETEGWLHESVALFRKYCLPSVQQHGGGRFDRIISFGLQSPLWLRDRIDELALRGSFRAIHRRSVSKAELFPDRPRLALRPIKILVAQVLHGDELERAHNPTSNDPHRIGARDNLARSTPFISVAARGSEYSNAAD